LQGCYEANPPFVPVMVEDMANHINELLKASCQTQAVKVKQTISNKKRKSSPEEDNAAGSSRVFKDGSSKPLCFIVVIPFWEPLSKVNIKNA
jgi:hypothetical protein